VLNKTSVKFLSFLVSTGKFEDVYEAANFILCLAPYPDLLYTFLKNNLTDTDYKARHRRKIKVSEDRGLDESEHLAGTIESNAENLPIKAESRSQKEDLNAPLNAILSMSPETLFSSTKPK
jgi:hypothetical protein